MHWRQDAGAVRQHIESLQADMQSTASQLDLTHGQLELAQDRVAYLQARCTDSDARTATLCEQVDLLRARCSEGECAVVKLTSAETEAAVRCRAVSDELVAARGKVAALQVCMPPDWRCQSTSLIFVCLCQTLSVAAESLHWYTVVYTSAPQSATL